MNNELKYISEGCLLVAVILLTAWVIRFCFSYTKVSSDSNSVVVINSDPSTNSVSSEGRTLFINNCASCHALDKKLTGPALAGVTDRIQDRKLLHDWIKNNKKVLQSGNAYFTFLYKEYNQTQMTIFPNLTDKQIDEILSYISRAEIQKEPPVPDVSVD